MTEPPPTKFLTIHCVFCSGGIEFPEHGLGTQIPCPHCQKTITLLRPAVAAPAPATPPTKLVICPDCREKISPHAAACPRCGAPGAMHRGICRKCKTPLYVTGRQGFHVGYAIMGGVCLGAGAAVFFSIVHPFFFALSAIVAPFGLIFGFIGAGKDRAVCPSCLQSYTL